MHIRDIPALSGQWATTPFLCTSDAPVFKNTDAWSHPKPNRILGVETVFCKNDKQGNKSVRRFKPSKWEIQMANQHTKNCSTSRVLKEMQIRTVMYHLAPIRLHRLKNIDNQCWHTRGEMNTYILLVKIINSNNFLQSNLRVCLEEF